MTSTRCLTFAFVFWVASSASGAMPGPAVKPAQAHRAIGAEAKRESVDDQNLSEQSDGDLARSQTQGAIDGSLRNAVERFLEAADRGDVATISATYASEFVSVRVADEGGFVRLTREQMLGFWKNATGSAPVGQPGINPIVTQKTTIHYAEALDDTGFVLLTRIKDIGNGWEPMFYNLVWKRNGTNWQLLREFVHQKSIPKQRFK